MGLIITSNISHTQSPTTFKYQSKTFKICLPVCQFDFNKIPLAPPGSKGIIHTKSSNRTSWNLNGKIGYYTGPAPNHHRCMTCYLPSTNKEIISNTLVFISHTISIPAITTDNFLTQAASDIVTPLAYPPSDILSSLQIGDSVKNGLLQLATLLNRNQITNTVITNKKNKEIMQQQQ